VFFVSSRVHPGETPSSFVFNGFFDFILREDDPRAAQLRRQFVFKLVPMLNPDGVVRGHYRTDARGVNLNRVYLDPSFQLHPPVYAVKSILVFHHVNNRVHGGAGDMFPASGTWMPNAPSELSTEGCASEFVALPSTAFVTAAVDNTPISKLAESSIVPDAVQTAPKAGLLGLSMGSGDGVANCSVIAPSELASPVHMLVQDVADDKGGGYLQPGCGEFAAGCFSTVASCNEAASGGECEDVDDVGNEGSDDEDDSTPITNGVYSPHLSNPLLRTIAPSNSGVAFYVDLHAHASKRGCFMYGNCLPDEEAHTDNVLFARLIAMNSAHFDFEACNFTERNMYSADRKEGLSKEGSGRVALYKTLGIKHWCSDLLFIQWL